MKQQNTALKMNISCLYKTARSELERKEAMIERLMARYAHVYVSAIKSYHKGLRVVTSSDRTQGASVCHVSAKISLSGCICGLWNEV